MYTLYTNEILDEIFVNGRDAQFAEKIAIHEVGGRKISYSHLNESVERLAKGLVSNGFSRGDRVLMLVRPSIQTLVIVLAVVRAGGVLVIADPAMGQAIFKDRMALAQPQWCFVEGALLVLQKLPWLRRLLRQRGVEIPDMPELTMRNIVNVGKIPFLGTYHLHELQAVVAPNDNFTERERDASDDLTVVFTSGTTGMPKGVVHTLHSMLSTILRVRDYAELTSEDVIYDTGILFILPTLMAGGTVVMGQGKFEAEATIKAYRDYGVTKTLEVPTNMKAIADYLTENGECLPATMDDILLGAAPVFADFLEQLQSVAHTSTRIWSIYGMTELLPASLASLEEKLAFDRDGGDLVGHLMDGLEAEIADDGELILCGDGLFDRYLGMENISKHRTGDMARLDEQGRIVLLGRKKDMIIRGKHNVYPPLFEPTIRMIEGVKDCALLGVYNPEKADEDIVLFIERDLTIDEGWLRDQLLSGEYSIDLYAHPDHIIFDVLPYSGRSLKLDKKALRDRARQHLGITEGAHRQYFEIPVT